MNFVNFESPLGNIVICEEDGLISAINFESFKENETPTPVLIKAAEQLKEYFDGKRQVFDLPLKTCGTPFQQTVFDALKTIPYGVTCSYKDIAIMLGYPNKSRAVGHANHRNPISIVVPCHRVIASDGKLQGYAGGLDKKEFLLALERANK